MSYIFETVTGTTGDLQFKFNGQFALKNYNVEIVNGNRLKVVSTTNEMFSLLEAEVSEVEINGTIYSDASAAQLALQSLVFSTSEPVILTKQQYMQLASAVQAADRGIISPNTPVPSGGWRVGWYTPKDKSALPGTNYPFQDNLKAIDGFLTKFYYNGTNWTYDTNLIPRGKIDTWYASSYSTGTQVFYEGKIYELTEPATATDVPGSSLVWKEKIGSIPSEIDKNFNESLFTKNGLYEDSNDAGYKNTGKIKVLAGTIVTTYISGDNAYAPKVAGIIVIKNGTVIERIYTGNPNKFVTLTYKAAEDVEIVINHRTAAFNSGYYYNIFYKPFYGLKDLNTTGGIVGFDTFKNSVYSTKAYTVEDDYVFKLGQVLTNGQFENGTGIEKRTDFIAIKSGETIRVDASLGTNAYVISFWSVNKTLVSGIPGNNNPNRYVFTAPQDGYVIISSMTLPNNFIGNFQGINVPVETLKFIAKNNIDAPLGVASSITGATKKSFEIPKTIPQNGILSIIDDDGNADVYNYLFPLLKSKNIPLGLAIAGGLIEAGNLDGRPSMTESQLIALKDEPLIEIMNHTFSHVPINLSNKNKIYQEIYKNHNWLLQKGIFAESFVSPFGAYNSLSLDALSNFYESHYSTISQLSNLNNFRNLEIGRINFGSDGTSVQAIKGLIDQAKANNQYIIIMTHVAGYNHYAGWRSDFEQIVDYIVSSGITVAKPTDAFNRIKNKFERYGDYKIGADGMRRKY